LAEHYKYVAHSDLATVWPEVNILQEEEMHDAGTQATEAFAGGDFREL
jgi:hypothetical protein